MRTVCLFALVGSALPSVAHADRFSQAHAIFSDNCARCHSEESLRPKTSKSKLEGLQMNLASAKPGQAETKKKAPDRLRQWVEKPAAVDQESLCEAGKLDPVQRELVIPFLRRASSPMQRPTGWQRPSAAVHNGYAARPEKSGPIPGQGDHR